MVWIRSNRTKPIQTEQSHYATPQCAGVIEGWVRHTGSFKEALSNSPIPGDRDRRRVLETEADRFATEFKGQARLTAERMLEGSLGAIHEDLDSYGLPFNSAIQAAKRLAGGTDVDTEAEHVVQNRPRFRRKRGGQQGRR